MDNSTESSVDSVTDGTTTDELGSAQQIGAGLVVTLAIILALITNIILVVCFYKSSHLRQPPFYLLLSLAVTDLVGVIFWAFPTLIAALLGAWDLGDAFCRFQGFVAYFGLAFNMHIALAITVQKFILIRHPARHDEVFKNKKGVLLLIAAIVVFDVVLAILPLLGWSEYIFYSWQVQCALNHPINISHLNFLVVVVIALPIIAGVVLYTLIYIRVRTLGKERNAQGHTVLREYHDVPKESFAEKLQKQEEKMKFAKRNKNVAAMGKNRTPESKLKTYGSVNDDSDSSDDDAIQDQRPVHSYEEARRQKKLRKQRAKKRIYLYRPRHVRLTLVMMIVWLIYVLLWFPYIVVGYVWSYHKNAVSDGVYLVVTCLTFFGLGFKPLFYLLSKYIRRRSGEVLRSGESNKKQHVVDNAPEEGTTSESVE